MLALTDEQAEDLLQLLRNKARAYSRCGVEQEDLVQEVMVRILPKLSEFDPARSSLATYVNRLFRRACHDYLRHQGAAKRGRQRTISLQTLTRHGHELSEYVDAEHHRLEKPHRSSEELRDLAFDLSVATAELEPREQRLCEQLKLHSIPDVADDERVNRGTIYRRMLPVREHLEDRGLSVYLT
jgi:RNA polymerase sigma factor (sigma-70 family)